MKGTSQLAPAPIRMEQDLKDYLKHRAIDNRRSFNSEVVARLEKTRQMDAEREAQGHPPTSWGALS